MFIWASGSILAKIGLNYLPPLEFIALRAYLATTCLFVIWGTLRILKKSSQSLMPRLSCKNLLHIVATGLTIQTIYQICFLYALQHHLSPGLLMIILGGQPIVTAIIMSDRLTYLKWCGLCLGLTGLCLTVFHSIFITKFDLQGIAFGIAALLAMTLGTIGQKRYCSNVDFYTNLFLQYLASSIVFMFIADFNVIRAVPLSGQFIFSILWLGLVVSVGSTSLYFYLINARQLTHVTTIFYGVPTVTMILDYCINGQNISTIAFCGFLITCLGLYFTFSSSTTSFHFTTTKKTVI